MTQPTKALSIRQPWANLIAHGIKNIENRTWRTHFRGRIFIHATKTNIGHDPLSYITDDQLEDLASKYGKLGGGFPYQSPISAIIGEVDIVDCRQGHDSVWAEHGDKIWNWVLENPVLYDKPIENVKGKLSFWNFNPALYTGDLKIKP